MRYRDHLVTPINREERHSSIIKISLRKTLNEHGNTSRSDLFPPIAYRRRQSVLKFEYRFYFVIRWSTD